MYICENCNFKSEQWIEIRKHSFENINHSVCHEDRITLNTIDNPI